jgi:DNA-directed RNA polymerase specialized sigma24 family protein
MERGSFNEVRNRDELWKLLVTITLNKTRMLARRELCSKRDVRRDVHVDQDENRILEQMDQHSPDPAEAAILADEAQRRLALLSPDLRQIAYRKLEGMPNEAIAETDQCTVRTIERKVAKICQLWS